LIRHRLDASEGLIAAGIRRGARAPSDAVAYPEPSRNAGQVIRRFPLPGQGARPGPSRTSEGAALLFERVAQAAHRRRKAGLVEQSQPPATPSPVVDGEFTPDLEGSARPARHRP
jgi:hypothetical protein